ncbi:nucleotidyltransferase family protein [Azohydromonas aeria]|uniref:nucleotidyltransferase family protein n=1 Tax=Azohydromonas aeria TaxID=2590212 RepID=UPI0012F7314A|nr:nucleotidyltransferase family protein [Azohydromonas aeria]
MNSQAPDRAQVMALLRQAEPRIRGFGVSRLALFGSVARGEARPGSDVDLLVEFGPGQKSFDRFMALTDFLEDLLGHPVEAVTTEALSPYIGPHILSEAADVLRAA